MYSIIACGVFQREIESLRESLGFPFEAHYVDPGLHVDFDELKSALEKELEARKGSKGIIVAFGQCHPRIDDIIKSYNAALIDSQNCVDAFITRKGMEKIAKEGLYFYLSPGWLDAWKDIFSRLNWGPEEARLQMGSFRGTIYMDTIGDAGQRELELMEFFDFTLLPYHIMPVNLEHFKSLIIKAKESLEDNRNG